MSDAANTNKLSRRAATAQVDMSTFNATTMHSAIMNNGSGSSANAIRRMSSSCWRFE